MILNKDRKDHGGDVDKPEVEESATDEIQQGVDEGIERAMQRATATAEGEEDAGDDDDAGQAPSVANRATSSQSEPTTPGPLED